MAPTVDAFKVRGEEGEEERKRVPWGLAVAVLPLMYC
jgi:hypothetical protein